MTTHVRPTTPTATASGPGTGPGANPGSEAPAAEVRLLRGTRPDGGALSLRAHLAVHGPLPQVVGRDGADALVALVAASGLRGRGGGRFPLADKLSAVRAAARRDLRRRRPSVVVNATESEPLSRKDFALLARTPHLVLDGAALAAVAVGAHDVVVWLHEDPEVRARLEVALAERAAFGPYPRFRVVDAADGYVAGEETAVVRALSGGPAAPTFAPPRVSSRGVDGRPSLVSNVETLAHLAVLARHGADWFRQVGLADDAGTQLLTVAGAVRWPGVVEVPVDVAVPDVVAAAGGVAVRPSGFLVGGYAGAWLDLDAAAAARWSLPGLRPWRAAPGVGLLVVLPPDSCPVLETARVTAYLARWSAGQCGPCRNGLPALAAAAHRLGSPEPTTGEPDQLARWAGMVSGRGACHHPDGVAALVASLLRAFPDEVAAHAAGRPCAYGPRSVLDVPGRTR
jgi:NADH:ubiquinone oxidoreductase subunit F (NADH-binding)